jgi:hypothetical protein
MQQLAAVDKHDPEKEKTIGLAKAYKDALDRDEAYQALRSRYLAANGAERRALDGEMREIERRHVRATGYEGHVRAAPPGKVRDARAGVPESINEVNRLSEEARKKLGILPHRGPAAGRSQGAVPHQSADLKEAERIIENHHRDRNSPEFRQAYDELRRSAKSPEQKAALADIEKKLAEQTTIENRHGRGNEKKEAKVAVQDTKIDAGLDGLNGPASSAQPVPAQPRRIAQAPRTPLRPSDPSRG